MQCAQNGDTIACLVQARPVGPKLAHGSLCRCRSKDRQPDNRSKPDGQINPQENLAYDFAKIKVLADRIKRQMNHHIDKCRNTDLATHLHQF